MLLSIDELNKSVKRYKSFSDDDKYDKFLDFAEESIIDSDAAPIAKEVERGNIIGDKKNRIKRKQMIESFGLEPTDFAFERAIGKNDSVYSNFIELIVDVKRKVGRIVIKNGSDNLGYATGFMISKDLLMTNWHVFKEKESVGNSVVEFNYELDIMGNAISPVAFSLNPDAFFHSFKSLDYCLVAVKKVDVTGINKLDSVGYIYLDPTSGKLGDENAELLNIIHHPDGDYKQLSIRENKFTKILDTTLWYESDTAQGSSGAPVFNDQWQVVALHHMGVPERNSNGDYLDKEGHVIPIINNKIEISRVHWIANEGIRISVILKDLKLKFGKNNPYIAQVLNSFESSSINHNSSFASSNNNSDKTMENSNDKVSVSFPSHLLDTNSKIDISFSVGSKANSAESKRETFELDELALESKRLERNMDYSLCKGYQSDFLGHDIPMPLPQTSVKRFAAKINGTNSIIMNYYKFSVIHNANKRMPFISAINVDGGLDLRKDETGRRDKWIRDNRIDFDVQLNNSFYEYSGFDRGHMSRREDANWGITAEEAKRNADLTCVHTNACPQVPTLNRSNRSGLWGKLENQILEYGAIKENNRTNKITVFSGPIFQDNDPTFKGVMIPTEYYKIILWLGNNGELKATGFALSQIDLIDGIDIEAIDLDKNIVFKEHMKSIKSIQKSTKIDFSHLFKFDTFKGSDNQYINIDSVEFLKEHMDNNS